MTPVSKTVNINIQIVTYMWPASKYSHDYSKKAQKYKEDKKKHSKCICLICQKVLYIERHYETWTLQSILPYFEYLKDLKEEIDVYGEWDNRAMEYLKELSN